MILAIGDVLAARSNRFDHIWFQAMGELDLLEMFARTSANRSIAQPLHAIATLIFEHTRRRLP